MKVRSRGALTGPTVHWFADALVSACAFCHRTFDTDAYHYKWDRKVEDLVQLLADHLIDE